MAENATIDTISYLSMTKDTNSASKTSANSSSDFAHLFDDINKTYSKADESPKNDNNTNETKIHEKTQNSNKTNESANKSDSSEKTNETQKNTSEEKTTIKDDSSEKNSSKNDESSNNTVSDKSEPAQNDKTATSSVEDKAGENTARDITNREIVITDINANRTEVSVPTTADTETTKAPTNDTTAAATTVITPTAVDANTALTNLEQQTAKCEAKIATDTNAVTNNAKTKTETETKTATSNTETVTNKQPTSTESTGNMTDTTDIATVVPTGNIIELMAPTTKNNDSTIAQNKDVSTIASAQSEQNQTVQDDFSLNLTNSTKTLNDLISSQTSKIKSQPQTQQELSTANSTQQSVASQPAQVAVADATIAKDSTAQTPVIQANTELLASDSNIAKTDNTNVKQVLNKTTLTQEVLDKTDAKVVSAEIAPSNSNANANANANSNNSLGQQSAQEQAIKLSIEGNSTTESSNQNASLAGITTNSATQSSFAKTIDSVQTTTMPQMPLPKELSQSEIMSQVNSKLNNLHDLGTTKISIILRPENLGKINLELINSPDGLMAKMTTDNAQVKEILDKSLDSLKDTLGNQGINVNSVSVKVENTQKQDMYSFEDNQSKGGNKGSQDETQKQNRNGTSFDEEMDNVIATTGGDAETDNLVSVGAKIQVDYKV